MRCPYPDCNNQITETDANHFICPFCNYSIIICPNCAALNRTYSKCCRLCSNKINYDYFYSTFLHEIANASFKSLSKNHNIEFPNAGENWISISDSFGFLTALTDRKLLILSPIPPHATLHEINFGDYRVIGVAISTTDQNNILITTDKALFIFKLAPHAKQEMLAEIDGAEFQWPAAIEEDIWWAVARQPDQKCLLYRGNLQQPRQPENHPLPLPPDGLRPLKVADHLFFLMSSSEKKLYHIGTHEIDLQDEGSAPANIHCQPCWDPVRNEIFFQGRDNLIYRFSIDQKAFFKVGAETFAYPQLTLFHTAPRASRLLVTHTQGLSLLDPYTGEILWDSRRNFEKINCAGVAPLITKNLVIFHLRDEFQMEGVELMSLNDGAKRRTFLTRQNSILATPAMTRGALVIPVKQRGKIALESWTC
jgi:hypothetical protein